MTGVEGRVDLFSTLICRPVPSKTPNHIIQFQLTEIRPGIERGFVQRREKKNLF